MAQYTVHDIFGDRVYECPDKCCLTCDHCTDVWWDYTHGPYMVACEVKDEPQFVDCEDYKEEQKMYKKGDIIVDLDSGIIWIVVSVSEYDYNCTRNLHLYREGTYQFSIPKDCKMLKVGSVRGIK